MNTDVYYYNPTCELAVANGSENFMANSLLRKMESDLDLLPAFYARPDDILLVQKLPPARFLDTLSAGGFRIPGLKLLEESIKDATFLSQPKRFLLPWGWSPSAHKLLSPIKPSCSAEFLNSPNAQWRTFHKDLYSRAQGVELLKVILETYKVDWMPPLEELPKICTRHEEIIKLQKHWRNIVVKSPWSSSGRGIQVLRPGEYNNSNQQVISGFLNQQGFVVAGPWYNKLLDLSFQFHSSGKGSVDFLGISIFNTDKLGRYLGGSIEEIPAKIKPELKGFISSHLCEMKLILNKVLSESAYSSRYQGWLGIDAILYESDNGEIMFHPCLEVNCRFTMGAITLALRKHLQESSGGNLRIVHMKAGDNILDFYQEMESMEPLISNGNLIVKGFLPLSPALPESRFAAYANFWSNKGSVEK